MSRKTPFSLSAHPLGGPGRRRGQQRFALCMHQVELIKNNEEQKGLIEILFVTYI